MILSSYALFYQISQTRIPSLQDYEELGLLTNQYVDTYYDRVFEGSTEVAFSDSTTVIVGTEFRLGQPVQVNYNTSIVFDSTASTFIPSQADLDAILLSAFTGASNATYLAVIQTGLQVTNIFSTSTAVNLEQYPVANNATNAPGTTAAITAAPTTSPFPDSSTTFRSNVSTRAGIAGGATIGAVAFLIIGALAIQYRHRKILEESSLDDGENLMPSSSRPYITKIDEDYTVSCESRTVYTTDNDDSKSDVHGRSLLWDRRHDTESLQSAWRSTLLDDDEDQEVESTPLDSSRNNTSPIQTTSSPWVMPRVDDGPSQLDEADEMTVDSSSVCSEVNVQDICETLQMT